MKRKATRILAMLLTALLVLSACGGNNNQPADNNNANTPGNTDNTNTTPTEPPAPSNGGEPIKDLVTWESSGSRELEEFFILHTERAADLNVLCNAYSPLLEINNKGQLQPAVAKEWGTEDGGKTWTFKLRDDVTWVDVEGNEKAKCTAQDWVTAMEWILNFEKNDASNTSMLVTMVEGAMDYYNYTKELDEAEALGADAVQAASKFVVTKECDAAEAYKKAYIDAKKEDIILVKSPVGMPGRAVRNRFTEHVMHGGNIPPKKCRRCLKKCNPAAIPYCITESLIRAVKGDTENGLIFCGADAYKSDRLETVAEVINGLLP